MEEMFEKNMGYARKDIEKLKNALDGMEQAFRQCDRLAENPHRDDGQMKAYETRAKELEAENERLKADMKRAEEEWANERVQIDARLKDLYNIAFVDAKFMVGNDNAFSMRAYADQPSFRSIVLVDICNMTRINREFTEPSGDIAISETVSVLKEKFGDDNVYRIRGAQFAVCTGDPVAALQESMKKMTDDIWTEQEFRIAYGISSIKNSDVSTSILSAKEEMGIMRDKYLAEEEAYEYDYSLTGEEASDQAEDASGSDDEPIKEVDATKCNYASDIIKMQYGG